MESVFFTDRKKVSDFEKVIKNLSKNSTIIIREYDLDEKNREAFAQKISALARARNLKVLVGKDFKLARKIKADGIHFSDFDQLPLQFFNQKSFPKNFIFSFACHSFKSFLKAKKLNLDMIFLAPIFPTSSHQETKIFGLKNLAKIAVKHKKQNYFSPPIFAKILALGGVNSQNLKALKKLKISGFGAIDYFSKNI